MTDNLICPKCGREYSILENSVFCPFCDRSGLEDFLKTSGLFGNIAKEFDKKVVGERDNCKAIFLTACGVFVENHQTASYNLCVNSSSGAGKDYVVKHILEIFPKEFVESRTRISQTAFTYWHNSKFEPEWSWDGKVCYLQDISYNILNGDVFKVMCSEGSHATVVIEQRAVDILIKGKPVLIITTAETNPKSEMLRRFPILTLDESVDQTKEIMKRQAKMAKLGKTPENSYSEDVTNSLRLLKRVKVRIPFTECLAEAYSSSHIIMRTHFQRLLDLIKASTALNQYQRETDSDGYYIAIEEDYENAVIALRQTTQNVLMIPLTKKQQKLLDLCKNMPEWFSAPELSSKCSFLSQQSVYNYLDNLQENFFELDERKSERSDKPVKVYKLRDIANIKIPTLEECKNFGNTLNGRNTLIALNPLIARSNSSKSSNSNPKVPIDSVHNSKETTLENSEFYEFEQDMEVEKDDHD